MSPPLQCLHTYSRNHFQIPNLGNLGILSWVGQQVEYSTLVDHKGVIEYVTKQELCIQLLFNRYKNVTVFLYRNIMFTVSLVLQNQSHSCSLLKC